MTGIKSTMNKETFNRHAYSFAKTFVTAFLAIAFFADQQGQDIFTVAFLATASKASLIAVMRNVYKLLSEK